MNKNNKARKYTSPLLESLINEMDNDPWYIKLKRWFRLKKWLFTCLTRRYWDKSYENYVFKKKEK